VFEAPSRDNCRNVR